MTPRSFRTESAGPRVEKRAGLRLDDRMERTEAELFTLNAHDMPIPFHQGP